MIRASYTAEGDIHTLSVHGHARYAERGKDIVCAGVSSLVQALIGYAENHPHIIECISIGDGDVLISCSGGTETAAVFDMTAIGLEQISLSYPAHVQIDIIGVAD